jgi:hypothetical protein
MWRSACSCLAAAALAACFEAGPLGRGAAAPDDFRFGGGKPVEERGGDPGAEASEPDAGAPFAGTDAAAAGRDAPTPEPDAPLPEPEPAPAPACEYRPETLSCGGEVTFATADPGLTASMAGYSCPVPFAGLPEHAVRFTADESGDVAIVLSGADAGGPAGLVVLAGGGGGCDPAKCLDAGESKVLFGAHAGETFAVVVEHPVSPAAALVVSAVCGEEATAEPEGPPAVETDCDDTADDDEDGKTDCEDPDCFGVLDCVETCKPFSSPIVTCTFGQTFSTGGGQAKATTYECPGAPEAPGKEIVYELELQEDTFVVVEVNYPDGAAYLLEDQGFGCSPVTCLDWVPGDGSFGPLGFLAEAGRLYYIAIDGPSEGSFTIEVSCP